MNPYYCYAGSFSMAILTYWLHWSVLYPKLEGPLELFLFIMIAAMVLTGYAWQKHFPLKSLVIARDDHKPWKVTAFLYVLWGIDFLYEGGIPLVKILTGQPYNYRLFGFPTLHVFTVTFSSFYTIFLFHLYLSQPKQKTLLFIVINLFAALLIYSRAMLIFNLTSCAIIYLFSLRQVSIRFVLTSLFGIIILAYLFGVLGTLRSSREANHRYDNALFLDVGQPAASFQNSIIPNEFFWSYVYFSSPLANLQKNVSEAGFQPFGWRRFAAMVNNEFLFDFISKRINRFVGIEREGQREIPGPFNVSTVYSRSFSYLNWWGIFFMGGFILIVPWIYLRFLDVHSPFFLSGIAILCTIYFFMFYENTIRFTGLGFQLMYPLLFAGLQKRGINAFRIFH